MSDENRTNNQQKAMERSTSVLEDHAPSAERLQATKELLDGIVQVLRDEANEADPAVYDRLVLLMVDVLAARQAL